MNIQQVRSWPVVLIQGNRFDGNALVMDKQDSEYTVVSVNLNDFYKPEAASCSTIDEDEATFLLNTCRMTIGHSVPELMEHHLQRFHVIGQLCKDMRFADVRTIQA